MGKSSGKADQEKKKREHINNKKNEDKYITTEAAEFFNHILNVYSIKFENLHKNV